MRIKRSPTQTVSAYGCARVVMLVGAGLGSPTAAWYRRRALGMSVWRG